MVRCGKLDMLSFLSYIMIWMPFTKGHIGYNKGIRTKGEHRPCLRCGTIKWFFQSRINRGEAKYCSRVCSNKSNSKRGENSPHWKEKVGYYGVHSWLYTNYGQPTFCEKCKVIGEKTRGGKWSIHWAKIEGKEYEKKRENFWALCFMCHMEYDGTGVKGGWNKGISWKDWANTKTV